MIPIPESELTFEFIRSSGPGGQNVNKVSSKARLRWSVIGSSAISAELKSRFLELFGKRLTKEGELILTSERHRDRIQNRDECLAKLQQMLQEAARPRKIRKATRPTRSSKEKRRREKKQLSEKKRTRSQRRWD